MTLASALYRGWVQHRRFAPRMHRFRYRVHQLFLVLDELEQVLADTRLFSVDRPNVVSFQRRDHVGDPARPLEQVIRDLVEHATGDRPRGRIALLTNPRYWGYVMNPVSFYYCFAPASDPQAGPTTAVGVSAELGRVDTIVAEVHNTPWGERHMYVLSEPDNLGTARLKRYRFDKDFHVSPFMPMEHVYDWRFGIPGPRLTVHMQNYLRAPQPGQPAPGSMVFDATMVLERAPLTARNLRAALIDTPFMTGKVIAAIYWQALRLWLKRVPFYEHPRTRGSTTR